MTAPQLLCVLSHPTQYDGPLWAAMARRNRVQPVVAYLDGQKPPPDPEQRRRPSWRASGGFEQLSGVGQVVSFARGRRELVGVLGPGWTKPGVLLAKAVAAMAGCPVVLPSDATLNERSAPTAVRVPRTALHAAKNAAFDGFFTTGTLGRIALRSHGVPDERICEGLYPVDVAWWRSEMESPENRQLAQEIQSWAGKDATVFLIVSKLHARENPLLAFRAFALAQRRLPSLRLVMVGGGELMKPLQDEVQSRQLDKVVRLEGHVPYRTLAGYYAAAQVLIHTPRREPWGISLSEAMSCGLPVIASTTVGSAADLVVPGRTGLLVPPDDEDILRAAIEQMSERAFLERTAAGAAARVHRLDVQTVAQGLERFLLSLPPVSQPLPWRASIKEGLRNVWGGWP